MLVTSLPALNSRQKAANDVKDEPRLKAQSAQGKKTLNFRSNSWINLRLTFLPSECRFKLEIYVLEREEKKIDFLFPNQHTQ